MATLAANEDGTGESFCYVAATGNIDLDLAGVLQNKVSFIRVLPIGVIKKKGVCGKDNDVVAALKPAWFYDWGTSDVSTNDIQYVPLTFGLNAATDLTRSDETVNVNIFDFSGRRIFNDKVHLQSGKNLISLDTSLKLAAHHLYVFTISGAGNHTALKFLSNF